MSSNKENSNSSTKTNTDLSCKEKPNYRQIDKDVKEWLEKKRHLDFHRYGKK